MSVSSVSPVTLFGGTWETWGAGKVPVSVDGNNVNFSTVEKTGGQIDRPAHSHGLSSGFAYCNVTSGRVTTLARYVGGWTGNDTTWTNGFSSGQWNDWGVNLGGTTDSSGADATGNLQPYITCYMWKRTS